MGPVYKKCSDNIIILLYVLGSEKIRLMERKMKNKTLGSDYSPAKTLQNELYLIKIGQSSQKI